MYRINFVQKEFVNLNVNWAANDKISHFQEIDQDFISSQKQ